MKVGAERWRLAALVAVLALLVSGCRQLRYDGPRDKLITVLVLTAIPVTLILLHLSSRREQKRDHAELAAFGASRGLAPETQNSVGGTVGDLRVRYQHIVDYGGGNRRTQPTRVEFAVYGPHSAFWPGESSVIFRAEAKLFGFSMSEAHILGLPTAVDPAFDQQRQAYTRFPVPAMTAVGQRLDGPHGIALPHHRRLAHLPVDAALRAWLLHRDWEVSVYAGRMLVRARPSSPGHTVDLDEAVALCQLISQHMPGWAECIRQAQAGAV